MDVSHLYGSGIMPPVPSKHTSNISYPRFSKFPQAAVRGFAALELAPAVKAAKNLLKNALSAPMDFRLVAYRRIARGPGGELALQDSKGDTILLDDAPWMEATTHRLPMLPDGALLQDQVLLGGFWYDGAARRLKLQPLSIVAAGGIVRLLY